MQADQNRLTKSRSAPLLDNKIMEQLDHDSKIEHLPAGKTIYLEGDRCDAYFLVLEGFIRVQKVASTGQEITLYHISPGQTCKLTNTCLLGGHHYPAEAITETDTVLLRLAKSSFDKMIKESDEFRQKIYSSIDAGMNDLVSLVQEIAFGPLDHRLAKLLLAKSLNLATISMTHKTLAIELGTAREVVSRLLKDFERRDWVKLRRGNITILNREALEKLQ